MGRFPALVGWKIHAEFSFCRCTFMWMDQKQYLVNQVPFYNPCDSSSSSFNVARVAEISLIVTNSSYQLMDNLVGLYIHLLQHGLVCEDDSDQSSYVK